MFTFIVIGIVIGIGIGTGIGIGIGGGLRCSCLLVFRAGLSDECSANYDWFPNQQSNNNSTLYKVMKGT